MRPHRSTRLLVFLVLLLSVACADRTGPTGQADAAVAAPEDVSGMSGDVADGPADLPEEPGDPGGAPPVPDQGPALDLETATTDKGVIPKPDAGSGPPTGTIEVATWNLHNFSLYGDDEWRLDDMVAKITDLDVDVLAVEELKLRDPKYGTKEAFEALVEKLPHHAGVHAPWNEKDTVVGLIYDTTTTTLNDWEVILQNEWEAFPRDPVKAEVTVNGTSFTVIVLHLKAFKDSVDRRRKACELLVDYVKKASHKRFVLIGDLNDDPYDAPAENSFLGTVLDAEPAYYFVTAALPPESVTSTGYHHYVGSKYIKGEFLDHAILTGDLYDDFSKVVPEIHSVPEGQFEDWNTKYSDHFPLVVRMEP